MEKITPHPRAAHLADLLSQSEGHAVGPRSLLLRSALTAMLALASASPVAATSPPTSLPQAPAATQQQAASWHAGVGFSAQSFLQDLKARGFSPEQTYTAYQWLDRLGSPTFTSQSHFDPATTQALADRSQALETLTQSIARGPAAFNGWHHAQVGKVSQLLSQATDRTQALDALEYLDGFGLHAREALALQANGQFAEQAASWKDIEGIFQRQALEFSSLPSSSTQVQAQAHLDQAVSSTGLRWFRAPLIALSSPGQMEAMAQMITQANQTLARETGLSGAVLGLNGRVAWDAAPHPGGAEAETREHPGGIQIRGWGETITHEFSHALNAAMDPNLGMETLSVEMQQLQQDIAGIKLQDQQTKQIMIERWAGLDRMAHGLGLDQAQITQLHDASLSREAHRDALQQAGLDAPNASYLASNAQVLHEQATGPIEPFAQYRVHIAKLCIQDESYIDATYLANQQEILVFQADHRITHKQAAETWEAPTATEALAQSQAWNSYYEKAKKWQSSDIQSSPASLADRLADRRAAAESLALAQPHSQPRKHP